jgi:hypothetical protein
MPRPDIRLDDLLQRGKRGHEDSRLMNVKIPVSLLERIGEVTKKLDVTKTDLVMALLNEGLDKAEENLKGFKAPAKPVVPVEKRCKIKGCEREKVAKGLCATHYQASRRKGK